jgi:hypothetical protein
MLDKLITYIVWWYKTVYQVLSVAWTNRITTCRYRDSSDKGRSPYNGKLSDFPFYIDKGWSPYNGKLSDFSFYIDSQISVQRKFKK